MNNPIWRLGDHLLARGSSSDHELLKRLIKEAKVDAIITDSPYGISYTKSKRGFAKIAVDKDIENDDISNEKDYEAFTADWLNAIKPYLNRRNTIYMFNSDKMLLPTVAALRSVGGKFAQLLIWAKTHAVIGRMDYLPQHELIIYGWIGVHRFYKAKDKSILVYPRPSSSKLHPTMKPVGLIRRLILNSTKINDTVFDGYLGSGTCLIACEQTHRKCIGVEIDKDYCQTIIQRWEQLTGQKAVILEDDHEN